MRNWAAAAGIVIISAACGSGAPAATTSTGAPVPTTTTTTSVPATTLVARSTTSLASTTTTEQEIDVSFTAGEVSGPESFQVLLGATVDVWVLSDVDDEMHVHGYDLFHDLVAGVPFHLSFVADVPGVFEVEVHTGHTRLFDIEVSG